MVKNLLKISDLGRGEILRILNDAVRFENEFSNFKFKKEHIIANLFFESSTRTHYSFLSAQTQLGLKILDANIAFSSVTKGESLYDTAKTFESIGANALVIRHKDDDYFKELQNLKIPIINAGDGCGNHPSQCILDLLTIKQNFEKFENLNVAIIGDIKHSRVAKSNISALKEFGSNIAISGPKEWMIEDNNYLEIDECIKWADVVMLLRVQNERLKDDEMLKISKDEYLANYGLTKKRYESLKDNAIIMHPAPVNRGVEIDSDLVEAPKSRIFKQMSNGVLARKAILKWVFEEEF